MQLKGLNGKIQIISADSVAVYKDANIGTAKPSLQLQKKLPHHLIDILSFEKEFSVLDFVLQADKICKTLWQKGIIPAIVGGTGFYIKNFMTGLPSTPPTNYTLRKTLQQRLQKQGKEALYKELQTIDPQSATKIHPNDAYRITRALEVFYTTGKKRSSYLLPSTLRSQYDFCTIILKRPKEELKKRIALRVNQMLQQGLTNEILSLIKKGATKDSPLMQGIGYKEYWTTPQKDFPLAVIHDTIKYAKRQTTYMKNIPNSKTFFIDDPAAKKTIKDFCLSYINLI